MQTAGKLLLGFSLIAAIAGGLYLASEVSRTQSFDAMFPLALVLFGVVTAVTAGGIYLYARGEQRDSAHISETSTQRRLVDALGGNVSVTFTKLAEQLDVPTAEIGAQLHGLTAIDVLPAAINWEAGIIYPKPGGYLVETAACLHCGQPLPDGEIPHVCPVCRTEHYDV
ncbi:MAG: zinc ribbon domain-containing protein [Chloroflexi bacterium]|nr:zinc ribbon domain-containing protein [Chloroflexota bacterium]NOG49584.1 zinc ribbon domain-containing protein [Chloroflexota bacterium]